MVIFHSKMLVHQRVVWMWCLAKFGTNAAWVHISYKYHCNLSHNLSQTSCSLIDSGLYWHPSRVFGSFGCMVWRRGPTWAEDHFIVWSIDKYDTCDILFQTIGSQDLSQRAATEFRITISNAWGVKARLDVLEERVFMCNQASLSPQFKYHNHV